jgi:hypothetical protein
VFLTVGFKWIMAWWLVRDTEYNKNILKIPRI